MLPRHEAEIAAMYIEREFTVSEIAEETLFCTTTVRRALRRQGIKPRYGRGAIKRKLSAEQVKRTIWLHEQGLSHRQMAEILGITVSSVRSRLAVLRKELGRPPKRQGCWGRAGEPKALPPHVRQTVAGWQHV